MNQHLTDQEQLIEIIVAKSMSKAAKKYNTKNEINTIVKREFEKQLEQKLKNYVTSDQVKKIINNALMDYPTKIEFYIECEKIMRRSDEKMRQYRDEILTKMDQIVGELAQIREDRLFEKHEKKEIDDRIEDHDTRIKKLEKQSN